MRHDDLGVAAHNAEVAGTTGSGKGSAKWGLKQTAMGGTLTVAHAGLNRLMAQWDAATPTAPVSTPKWDETNPHTPETGSQWETGETAGRSRGTPHIGSLPLRPATSCGDRGPGGWVRRVWRRLRSAAAVEVEL